MVLYAFFVGQLLGMFHIQVIGMESNPMVAQHFLVDYLSEVLEPDQDEKLGKRKPYNRAVKWDRPK